VGARNFVFLVAASQSTADCPGPLGGLSAVVTEEATRNLCVSSGGWSVTADCPALGHGLSAGVFCQPTRNLQISGGAPLCEADSPGLVRRTVRTFQIRPFCCAFNALLAIGVSTADCPAL